MKYLFKNNTAFYYDDIKKRVEFWAVFKISFNNIDYHYQELIAYMNNKMIKQLVEKDYNKLFDWKVGILKRYAKSHPKKMNRFVNYIKEENGL